MSKNKELKQAIKKSRYTQEQLGVKIGVTGQTICNAVNGRKPHLNTRKAICKTLGRDLGELFGDDKEEVGG